MVFLVCGIIDCLLVYSVMFKIILFVLLVVVLILLVVLKIKSIDRFLWFSLVYVWIEESVLIFCMIEGLVRWCYLLVNINNLVG